MATQQQLLLRQKHLQNKIKPTADPLEAEKNKKRFDALQDVQNQLTTKRTQPDSGRFGAPTATQPVLEGKPDTSTIAPADGGVDTRTYAEIGKSLADASYNISDLEKELYGDTKTETSMDKYFKNLITEQERQAKRAEESLAYQKEQTGEDTALARNQIEQAGLVQEGQLFAGGREGVTSGSNVALAGDLAKARNQQITRLQSAQNEAFAQIEDARAKLAFAEKQGRRDLVAQYQSELDAAEMQAKQIDTDYISALTEQSAEERAKQAQQAQNVESFATLVQQGTEMDYNTIASLASQYGLPTDMLMGYYQGAQAIRDDKTLDLATKETQLAQLNQDLSDQVAGMNTQAAQLIKGLETLRASGAPDEVIQAYKSAAGITDYDDPLTQAELAYNQAKAKVAYNEANGIITSPLDMIDLAQKTYDYFSQIGYTAGSIPTSGEYGASYYTQENGLPAIMVNVQQGQSLDVTGTERDEGQCGAFVNDFFGESMFGDSFEEKMGLVDRSIQVPEPGMAFVMETESPYGHVGIVEYVDPSRGVMGIVDANWSNDGKVQRREIPITSASGFVRPPNAEPADQPVLSTLDEKTIDNVRSEAGSFRQEQIVKDYNTILNKKLSVDAILDAGVGGPGDLALVFEFMKALDPTSVVRETEYENAAKSGNIFAGSFARFNGYLKEEGGFLPEQVKTAFQDLINVKLDASQQQYDNLYSEYSNRINNLAGGKNVAPELLTDYSAVYQTQGVTQVDPEEEYLNTLVDYGTNADLYDYIDSKTTTGNKSFGSGFGSLSPFKK